jgi:hypothetical protein
MKRIRTTQSTIVLAVAALVFTVGFGAEVAWADSPHFIDSKTKCAIETDGDLSCSFKEAGLGDAETTYELGATAAATCTCVTNSGSCPNAANKVTSSSELSATGTFSPKNGTVSATLTLSAPECPSSDPPTCGRGQTLELSAITYTDISLEDVTNGVAAGGLPATASATFFTCP